MESDCTRSMCSTCVLLRIILVFAGTGEIDCDAFKVPLLKALLGELRQNDAIRLDRILPTLPSLENPNFIEAFREYSLSATWTQFIKKQVPII